ncbi:uncharacterized protein F4822DRAFT_429687 [Hypoxylon trugodes]|uniref:uncharacterized protein n=1 Tax=Hypoxylon trugodes TaxID=326681 RepID=UPI0021996BF2|nr:uncharacterized protein F4822DRAFT_429687 [Hypoxylon trugodes]KAI1389074.1 hypothetical protein F4822DRAFT_429687 [Hypoxylon trugodes]
MNPGPKATGTSGRKKVADIPRDDPLFFRYRARIDAVMRLYYQRKSDHVCTKCGGELDSRSTILCTRHYTQRQEHKKSEKARTAVRRVERVMESIPALREKVGLGPVIIEPARPETPPANPTTVKPPPKPKTKRTKPIVGKSQRVLRSMPPEAPVQLGKRDTVVSQFVDLSDSGSDTNNDGDDNGDYNDDDYFDALATISNDEFEKPNEDHVVQTLPDLRPQPLIQAEEPITSAVGRAEYVSAATQTSNSLIGDIEIREAANTLMSLRNQPSNNITLINGTADNRPINLTITEGEEGRRVNITF